MTHENDARRIDSGKLYVERANVIDRVGDIVKRAGPATTRVANAPILDRPGGKALPDKTGRSGRDVLEIVLCAPTATMDHHDEWNGVTTTRQAKLTELEEEHGGEDGAFSELDKVNKGNVTARLREIEGEKADKDEAAVLKDWLKAKADEDTLKKQLADAEDKLDAAALAKYPSLSEDEVKAVVVDDKWLAALNARIHSEMDRVSQQLTARVKELAERYERPLPDMTASVAELEAKVNRHLAKMGFACQ